MESLQMYDEYGKKDQAIALEDTEINEAHQDVWCSVMLWWWWGDEWKWKGTSFMTPLSDTVIRFQWGNNAGHTVVLTINGKEVMFDLHSLPSWVTCDDPNIINFMGWNCVVPIEQYKRKIEWFYSDTHWFYCSNTLEETIKRDDDGNPMIVWVLPEINQVESKWIPIHWKWKLYLSWEAMTIWVHDVLSDLLNEELRKNIDGIRAVWSTGSWISSAYSNHPMRRHLTVNNLLNRSSFENEYIGSLKEMWALIWHSFPRISFDEIKKSAEKDREKLLKLVSNWTIIIVDNEYEFIQDQRAQWRKLLFEWAQAALIGSKASNFWTASNPSAVTLFEQYWIREFWNIFIARKLPPSSVWTRAQFLSYPPLQELINFRKKYWEFWVTSKRPRDLWMPSLPEISQSTFLNTAWFDEDRIVNIHNRIDWVHDMVKLHQTKLLAIVIWYMLHAERWDEKIDRHVWLTDIQSEITPRNCRKNYPQKSAQSYLYDTLPEDLVTMWITWNTKLDKKVTEIWEWIMNLVKTMEAASVESDKKRLTLLWTWKNSDDLVWCYVTPNRMNG